MYQTIASFSAFASKAITEASRSTSPCPSAGVQPRLNTTRLSGRPLLVARSRRSFLTRLTVGAGGGAYTAGGAGGAYSAGGAGGAYTGGTYTGGATGATGAMGASGGSGAPPRSRLVAGGAGGIGAADGGGAGGRGG